MSEESLPGKPRVAQATFGAKGLCPLDVRDRILLAREQAARAEAEAALARLRAVEYVTEAALSNLQLDELLHQLLSRIRHLLGGDTARLLLLTEDGRNLKVRAFDGLGPEVTEDVFIPVGQGVAGRIAAAAQPMIFDDLRQVEVVSPTLKSRTRSLIGAPLTVRGRLIGVVDVGTTEPHRFSQDDLRLLQLVADRAALAIENAHLYHEARFERSRWQATVESMLNPVAVADAAGRIVYMNSAYRRQTGRAFGPAPGLEELPGPYRLFHPDGRPFEALNLPLRRAALRGEEVRNVEIVQRGPDGQERVAVWNAAPLRADEQVTGAVTVGRDVTEERRAEAERSRLLAEVQRQAAELDATIASIADGLIIYDPAGEILRINAAGQDILAYTPEERRRPLAERLAMLRIERPDGRPFPMEETPPQRALQGAMVRGVVAVIHPPADRTVWVSASAAPIRSPDGTIQGAVMTYTDITRLHDLQEQREDILRAVSHDLRNPLAVILAQAQLLLRALERAGITGAERSSGLAILTSAQRMDAMIQELVESIRLEAGQLRLRRQPVNLQSTLDELKRRLAGPLETERVRVEAPPGLPPVCADPGHLERVLTNLLSNALKYSTPGSEVLVRLTQRDGDIVTSISDRGPGIAPEQVPRLFTRYYRVPRAGRPGEGLGLGLYITRMLVEAQGGRIWAESQVGVGSTFGFALPIARAESS